MKRTTLLVSLLIATLITAAPLHGGAKPKEAPLTWFDLPRNTSAFTAANDATFTPTTILDYSADFLDQSQRVLVLSANVDGYLSANGGPSPHELYVALPSTVRAPRQQSFPVTAFLRPSGGGSQVPVDATAVTTGAVVSIRRTDGGTWPDGGVGFSFVNLFAVEPRTTDPGPEL